MTAIFESIGDSGNFQVDSNFKNLALNRKGVLASQQYTSGETTNTSPTRVQIVLNDGEILALACTLMCSLGSKVGSTANVYVDGPAGTQVEYYVFKPGGGPGTFGLEVFDEIGDMTFSSTWKLFDVRRIMTGFTSLSMPAGKKYAFVQTQIQSQIRYVKVVMGQGSNTMTNYFRDTSFSSYRINNNLVECALSAVDLAATRPQNSGTTNGFSQTINNNVSPIALILDVTNF